MPSFLRTLLHRSKRPSSASYAPTSLPELILAAGKLAAALEAGQHGNHTSGYGEDFWQFRPHMPQEPASMVDWKQSARSPNPATLWVRERERQTPQQLLLWCDRSASMNWRSDDRLLTKRDDAFTALLALGQAALKAGERVGVLGGPRCYSGPHNTPRLARDLMEAPSMPHLNHASPHTHVVLASDFLWPDPPLTDVLHQAQRRSGTTVLLTILDPQERHLSAYAGHTRFTSDEDPHPVTLPAVETLREAYQQRMTQHMSRLSQEGRHTRSFFHRTDHSLGPLLMALHHLLGGKR